MPAAARSLASRSFSSWSAAASAALLWDLKSPPGFPKGLPSKLSPGPKEGSMGFGMLTENLLDALQKMMMTLVFCGNIGETKIGPLQSL